MTGSNHNVTANTSQDREFIPVENERLALVLFACLIFHSFTTAWCVCNAL